MVEVTQRFKFEIDCMQTLSSLNSHDSLKITVLARHLKLIRRIAMTSELIFLHLVSVERTGVEQSHLSAVVQKSFASVCLYNFLSPKLY